MAHKQPQFSLIFLIFFSLSSLTVVQASALHQGFPRDTNPLQRRAEEDMNCETSRSSDYYGLGVRLGIYFAWLTSYLANTALPDEIAGALDTNSIFLFALLVSMIRCSVTGMLQQLDGLILMHLSAGTLFGVLSLWGYRACHFQIEGSSGIRHFGGFGTHFRLLLSTAISVFGLWYWMHGVKGGLTGGTSPNCDVLYTFMFAKVRATGGIRIFYIFICIACTIYFGTMLLVSSLAGYSRVSKMITLAKNKQWAMTSRLRFATGLQSRELRIVYNILRTFNIIWLIFSAIMVEFTLNFNHVKGVLGENGEVSLPAQLLPLLIGAFSFVRIVWIWFETWRSPDDTNPSLSLSPSQEQKPMRSATLHAGLGVLKVFSPRMSTSARSEDTAVANEEERASPLAIVEGPVWQRLMVTWLPWLSLLWTERNKDIESLQSRPSPADRCLLQERRHES